MGGVLKFVMLTLALLQFTGCSSLLYHPSKQLFYDPKKLKLNPKEVFFSSTAESAPNLHAWHFSSRKKNPKGIVVQFHGNAENLSSHFLSLVWLINEGYDLFIFDYQGYGKSGGTPSQKGTVEDGIAALRWVYEHHPKTPIVVYGQSLGSAVAMRAVIEVKHQVPIHRIVIEGGFASYQKAGSTILSNFWLTWLFQPFAYVVLSDQWAPKSKMQFLAPVPLLFIHGEKDPVVDISLGRHAFKLAPEPKRFMEVPEGGHLDTYFREKGIYRKELIQFMAR